MARVALTLRGSGASLGTSVERRTRADDPKALVYYVVMHDPKCNEFCIS
jgi:hypothetical protein